MATKSEKREEKRRKLKNKRPSLADQIKRTKPVKKTKINVKYKRK